MARVTEPGSPSPSPDRSAGDGGDGAPVAARHWLADLYARLDGGDVDALRAVAAPEYRLQVLELGVDIAGIEPVLAWVRARGHHRRHELVSVVEDQSFVVATVRFEGRSEPSRCHVYTRSRRGLLSCCVIAGAREQEHGSSLPTDPHGDHSS